ncbi:hypothetical protein BGX38DRAFT_1194617, partial [Terfezia claveryi]
NHINAIPQIIRTYTRGHNFAMREKNIEQWISDLPHIPDEIRTIIPPPRTSLHLSSDASPEETTRTLQGRLTITDIYNLETLQTHYKLPDLLTVTASYLAQHPFRQLSDPETDAARLMDTPLEAFLMLQVAVPTFNDDGHMIHRIHYTADKLFRKQDQRHDWVFVRHQQSSPGKVPAGLESSRQTKCIVQASRHSS